MGGALYRLYTILYHANENCTKTSSDYASFISTVSIEDGSGRWEREVALY